MIDPQNKTVSLSHQCQLLSPSRSSWYYESKGESPLNLSLMRLIDKLFLKTPYYGSRQMARHLFRIGYCVGRKRNRRLMRLMGLEAIYQSRRCCVNRKGCQ
ncbi:IS3 family transposase [Candidatus Odyssella acanthamoebae]|uniref:IS3 family transposase n=1 Tax=Candidatus Odyssella acanthamoebae TaxID=91604 RepID=UPI00068A2599|nr:IS3 family transposase [Candidatus Paracaedibacter acanthamoebae]